MPYKILKGKYHVSGYSPDGDTIRFQPDDTRLLDSIRGPNDRLQINSKQHVSLRFDGVDAPETHYSGNHQPKELGDKATDFVTNSLGITNIVWNDNRSRVASANDGIPGYILTRSKDLYGRIISFVFAGDTSENDGDDVFLDTAKVKDSINYKLLETGLGYPAYYDGLFPDLRESMTSAVKQSRGTKTNVWSADRTHSVNVSSISSITEEHMVFPKLFRRLVSYFEAGNNTLSEFESFMEDRNDRLLLLYSRQTAFFDDLIRVDKEDNNLSMNVLPESIVFQPRT